MFVQSSINLNLKLTNAAKLYVFHLKSYLETMNIKVRNTWQPSGLFPGVSVGNIPLQI